MRQVLIAVALFLASCSGTRHIAHTTGGYTPVSGVAEENDDLGIDNLIQPYKVQLDSQMNEVIGIVSVELVKRKPEGTLGNWAADAVMSFLVRKGFQADMTLLNHGGLRVPEIQPGPLTVGELYELSPFDNMLVIVEVPGPQMDSLMRHIAAAGGWPVSAGVRMVISRGKLGSFTLHGQPLDPDRTYRVGMPDYVANGGDGSKMLIPLRQIDTGILLRDALIDEARHLQAGGRPVMAEIEGRTIIEYP